MKTFHAHKFTPLLCIFFVGCATVKETNAPTEESLTRRAANELGFAPNELKVSNIRADGGKTYFVVTAAKDRYACSVYSGVGPALVSAMALGTNVELNRICMKQ
jgi:hypothetical protein